MEYRLTFPFAIAVISCACSADPFACEQKFKNLSQFRVEWIDADYFNEGGVGLNNAGQIVGVANGRVFVWQNGRKRFPASLKYIDTLSVTPYCINDRGQIAGTYQVARSGAISYSEDEGFLWDGKRLLCGRQLPGGLAFTIVQSVNNNRKLAGSTIQRMPDPNNPGYSFFTNDSAERGVGVSINDNGIVVGYKEAADREHEVYPFAVMWDQGRVRRLTSLGGQKSLAAQVNNQNVIAGFSQDLSGRIHAVCWKDRRIQDLSGPSFDRNCEALSINEKGQIVGRAWLRTTQNGERQRETIQYRAVLWESGKRLDLNKLTFVGPEQILEEARRINRRGQIVGFGRNRGVKALFLLTPR